MDYSMLDQVLELDSGAQFEYQLRNQLGYKLWDQLVYQLGHQLGGLLEFKIVHKLEGQLWDQVKESIQNG